MMLDCQWHIEKNTCDLLLFISISKVVANRSRMLLKERASYVVGLPMSIVSLQIVGGLGGVYAWSWVTLFGKARECLGEKRELNQAILGICLRSLGA